MQEIMNSDYLVIGINYPKEFVYLVEHQIFELRPWKLMSSEWLQFTHDKFKTYFPGKLLVPFAAKADWGDIAFFDFKSSGDYEIVVLHGNDIGAWERREIFESVWEWFKRVSDDFIEFATNELG
jgi:hypothetical protein